MLSSDEMNKSETHDPTIVEQLFDKLMASSKLYMTLASSIEDIIKMNEKLVKAVSVQQQHISFLYEVISDIQSQKLDSTYDNMLDSLKYNKNEKLN